MDRFPIEPVLLIYVLLFPIGSLDPIGDPVIIGEVRLFHSGWDGVIGGCSPAVLGQEGGQSWLCGIAMRRLPLTFVSRNEELGC